MRLPYVLIYIRIAKPFVLPLQIFASITNNTSFSQNSNETRRPWAVLAAPVVANSGEWKHAIPLCEFKSVLVYTWIAKPFVLPLQIFASITNNTSFSQNSNETRRIWAVLAAPVVANSGKKTCDSLMWIQKCVDLHKDRQTLCFTFANVRADY